MYSSTHHEPIAVVGATGHTGRFVLDQLQRRGFTSILVARDAEKLAEVGAVYRRSSTRLARIDSPGSLDQAIAGSAAVINCAGPFLDTALPVVEAALRAKIPYLDVTAEQPVVQAIRARDADARRAAVTVVAAAAFYGGLADLLATSIVATGPMLTRSPWPSRSIAGMRRRERVSRERALQFAGSAFETASSNRSKTLSPRVSDAVAQPHSVATSMPLAHR